MSQTLAAIGGTPPYTWTALDPLPAGLSLSSAGVLSGSPSAETAGAYYTIQVQDAASNTAILELWITVLGVAAPVPPVVEVLQRELAIVPELGVFIQSPLIVPELAVVPEIQVSITLSVTLDVFAQVAPELEVSITNIPVISVDLAVIPEIQVAIENQLVPVEAAVVPELEVKIETPSVLFMTFEGADGSTSFIDSSPFPKTFSIAAGSPTISTAQFAIGNSSLWVPRPSLITTPDSNDWDFPGDFSVSCYVRVSSFNADQDNTVFVGHYDFPNNQRDWFFGFDGSTPARNLYFFFAQANNSTINSQINANESVPLNTWTKVSVSKVGSTATISINDVVKNTGTLTYQGGSDAVLSIGGIPNNQGVNFFDGYIDQLIITKG